MTDTEREAEVRWTEHDRIRLRIVVRITATMREAQRAWFKHRKQHDLVASTRLEKIADKATALVFDPQQPGLFDDDLPWDRLYKEFLHAVREWDHEHPVLTKGWDA